MIIQIYQNLMLLIKYKMIININSDIRPSYPLFEENKKIKSNYKSTALQGIQEKSELSLIFF